MKRTMITAAMIAVILTVLPVWAQTEADFEVKQNHDNTLIITDYTGRVKDVVIPDTLYGLKVTQISSEAFAYKELTSVVIPDAITEIGGRSYEIPGSFQGNKLTKVTFGKGLKTIGVNAFRDNHTLTKIEFPDSLIRIENNAFLDCGLTNIVFGKGLQTIDANAFRSNMITKLTLPVGLQEIRDNAFSNNGITELILPVGLKKIQRNAFAFNQIRALIIPNGVTQILDGAFTGNPIETLVIPSSLAEYKEHTSLSLFIGISKNVFTHHQNLTRVTLPEGLIYSVMEYGNNFDKGLVNFYINQNRAAGTYVKRGPIWTKE